MGLVTSAQRHQADGLRLQEVRDEKVVWGWWALNGGEATNAGDGVYCLCL